MSIILFLFSLFCIPTFITFSTSPQIINESPCIYYWMPANFNNFGDYLSLKLFERILQSNVNICKNQYISQKKILGIGSILAHANNNDIIWGSGAKTSNKKDYRFRTLDVRAVRGPLTRKLLIDNFNIKCPEVYGDPALLVPLLFPEFKKEKSPQIDYLIIPHYSENHLFPKEIYKKNVVYTTDPWDYIIKQILNSKFVISSSLHGIIIAEAYNIPARFLRVTDREPIFKYQDYYLGTNRRSFKYATSVTEAIKMGGEKSFKCDLQKLYKAFPFDYWPDKQFKALQ